MAKRLGFPQLFKYFPSSSYGKYDFIYGEKRKLNYWFVYNVFPVYGRYWFYYEIVDNIYIVDNEILVIPAPSANFRTEEGTKLKKYGYKDGQFDILSNEFYTNISTKKKISANIQEYALWAKRREGMQGFISSSSSLLQRLVMEVKSLSDYLILREVENKVKVGDFINLLERFGAKEVSVATTKEMKKTISMGIALCRDKEIAKHLENQIAEILIENNIDRLELLPKLRVVANVQNNEKTLSSDTRKANIKNSDIVLHRDFSENLAMLDNDLQIKEATRKNRVNRTDETQMSKVSRSILKDQGRDTVVDFIDRKIKVADREYIPMVKKSKLSTIEQREYSSMEKKEKNISNEKAEVFLDYKISKKTHIVKKEESFLQKDYKSLFSEKREKLFNYKLPKDITNTIEEKRMDFKVEKEISIEKGQEKPLVLGTVRELLKTEDWALDKEQSYSIKVESPKRFHKIASKETIVDKLVGSLIKEAGNKNNVEIQEAWKLSKESGEPINLEFETLLQKQEGGKNLETKKDVLLNKVAFTEERRVVKEKENLLDRIAKVNMKIEATEKRLVIYENFKRKKTGVEKEILTTKTPVKSIGNIDEQERANRVASKAVNDSKAVEKRLELHKRLWFIKQYDTVDYKILPKNDYEYPPDIGILLDLPKGQYQYSYFTRYKELESVYNNQKPYIIEAYDKKYKLLESFSLANLDKGNYSQGNIEVKIEIEDLKSSEGYLARYDIIVNKLTNVAYLIIRQPKDSFGNYVIYTATEKFIENKHPLPMGQDMGIREVPIHLPIMVEFVNILLLFWAKYYLAFTGYTGTMAIFGMVNMVYDWLSLASSSELAGEAIEDYYRCFRWFRWEAEKVYNKAKHDPDLSGNLWVEEIIFEMIDYVETHHVNIMPQFKQVHIMDEYRNLFADPSFDIEFIIDKVKGVRKRVLDKNKRLND